MKVVIVGCGRIGAQVASDLFLAGHEVAIIDLNPAQFRGLSGAYRGKRIVGNGTEHDTLRRAGIESADVFMAVTQGDNRNIMASQIARVIFNVPRVYTRIKDPLRAESFAHAGLLTVCTTKISSDYMLDAILSETPTS